MATNNNNTKTKNSSKSSIWGKSAKLVGKNALKGVVGAGSYLALDRMNKTSSLYYDPTTGKYIDTADMDPIWQKNLANNSDTYNVPYTVFSKWPAKIGESINDIAEINDPATRELISTGVDLASYAIPYYGVLKGTYDVGNKVVNTVLDTNRDIDMIKDLRYGDLGYSNKWLLEDGGSPIWEGVNTSLANDWFHNLTGYGRRTGFSPQSDVYKLGQQTTIKMMQKMLEDTGNFDPANAKSRVTLNQFNMMNQLLKNSDAYWQFQNIKNSQDMNDADFSAYLEAAGIDENTYKGMEYAAKQLYNLGDNQERNGLRYDPKSNFSTNTPMIHTNTRSQSPLLVSTLPKNIACTDAPIYAAQSISKKEDIERVLKLLHDYIDGKNGSAICLPLLAVIRLGKMTKPTHTQIINEFGEVITKSLYNAYMKEYKFNQVELDGVTREIAQDLG